MQIIIATPVNVTVWWYTPRKNVAQWYIQAMRPRWRGGERAGFEYCILSHLDGRVQPLGVRYTVTPYCNLGTAYVRAFSAGQYEEACRYMKCVAARAYRLAVSPSGNLWWHPWHKHFNENLEAFHVH